MEHGTHTGGVTRRELLLMGLILLSLAVAAIPRISRSAQNVLENACDGNVSLINAAVERYARRHGRDPKDDIELKDLILDNPACFPEGPPTCPLGGTYIWHKETRLAGCTH